MYTHSEDLLCKHIEQFICVDYTKTGVSRLQSRGSNASLSLVSADRLNEIIVKSVTHSS